MKTKIFFMFLFAAMLSSCSSVMQIGNSVVWAKDKYEAKERVAGRKVVEYVDRNSGITVSKSEYLDYAYGLYFGNLRIINNGAYVEVSRYAGGRWGITHAISKEIIKNYEFIAYTNQIQQRILMRMEVSSIYITVYQKNLVVGRYKM